MRRGVALLVLLVVPACTTPADPEAPRAPEVVVGPALPAPPMPETLTPPQWRVGDRWDYSDEYSITVSEVLADGATRFRLTDGREQWMLRRAFFVDSSLIDGVTRTVIFRTGNPMQLFSVPTGTPVTYMRETLRNGETLRHGESWVVEGRETVTVPAGTFDCWIVVGRISGLTSRYQGYERWWYSPVARNYVRLEFKYGDSTESSRVLLSYHLQ
ncbi:MAG: hypothetical protein H7840_01925 [Alphaproteobacteria bacterium]